MNHERIPEKDWKVFRELRDAALERFCERVLDEIEPIKNEASLNFHERYRKICRHLDDCDEQLANIFNDLNRSRALMQLAGIYGLNLLQQSEFGRFSEGTREKVQQISELFK